MSRPALLAAVAALSIFIPASPLLAASGGGGGGGSPGASAPMYDPAAEYQQGVEALKGEKWKEAQRAFGHVTEAAPKLPEGWFLFGYFKAQGGDLKGARKAYERAAKLEPEDIATRRELAVTHAKLGDADKANAELTGLAAYVRALDPAACPARGQPRSASDLLDDADRAVAAGRAALGRIDERYAGLEDSRAVLRQADAVLAKVAQAVRESRPDAAARLAGWRPADLAATLDREAEASLFNPSRLAGRTL